MNKINLPNFKKTEQLLFVLLVLIFLIPLWTNKYYLTGDGPCHLYNAKVLLDWMTGNNVDFYKQYYFLNTNFEPNWFSHITLAFLLTFLPAFLAEKIFLTAYVLLYALVLRLLFRTINKENAFLSILGLPFIYHHTFQMGFYNYAFSILLYLGILCFWLKYHHKLSPAKMLLLALLLTLQYFMHLVGLVLSLVSLSIILFFNFLMTWQKEKEHINTAFRSLYNKSLQLIIVALPAILLVLAYIYRKGLNPSAAQTSLKSLYHQFIELTSLITMTNKEPMWAITLAVLFALILIYAIRQKIKNKSFNKYDVFFVLFIMMVFIYFNTPGGMAGGAYIPIRIQFIPYLILLLWFVNIHFAKPLKVAIAGLSFTIGAMFMIVRIPHHALASKAVEEYISVKEHIKDRSTVLPLSFSHNGKTPEGKLIADRIWLFMHAADYIGTNKSLVLFGNYEGNTWYFPIIWRPERNPFHHISTNEGLEFQPPSVNIIDYKNTGGSIDYVITWCLDDQYMNHPYTENLLKQLDQEYELIYTSENALAKLYKKVL